MPLNIHTPSGLVSPDNPSGSPATPEASSTPPPPPSPCQATWQDPHIHHPLCPYHHSTCLGTCHCSLNENAPSTAEGQNMRSWVLYLSLTSLEDFLMWELGTLQYDAITVCFPSRNPNQPDSLVSHKPNSIRHLIMLRKYIHHLLQDSHLSVASDTSDHVLEPANFLHTTFHQFMSWKLNEITTSSPSSSLSSTSMSISDNWMKSPPLRNLCPINRE